MINIRLSKIKTNGKKKKKNEEEQLHDLGITLLIYCGIKENRF